MEYLVLMGVVGLAWLILVTRDNIYASLLLAGLGLTAAFGVFLHLGELGFILTALVYIVASLTLVIVAASTLGDVQKTVEMRGVALAALASFALLLAFPSATTQKVAQGFDLTILPLAAVLAAYVLKIAFEITT